MTCFLAEVELARRLPLPSSIPRCFMMPLIPQWPASYRRCSQIEQDPPISDSPPARRVSDSYNAPHCRSDRFRAQRHAGERASAGLFLFDFVRSFGVVIDARLQAPRSRPVKIDERIGVIGTWEVIAAAIICVVLPRALPGNVSCRSVRPCCSGVRRQSGGRHRLATEMIAACL
jgi:hypothetical protein